MPFKTSAGLGLLLKLGTIDDAEFPRFGPVIRNLNPFRREVPLCDAEVQKLLHELAEEYDRMARKVWGRAQAS
jgi:hypothetical protein